KIKHRSPHYANHIRTMSCGNPFCRCLAELARDLCLGKTLQEGSGWWGSGWKKVLARSWRSELRLVLAMPLLVVLRLMSVGENRKRKCRNSVCACTGWCRYTEEEWQERNQRLDDFAQHQRYLIRRNREQRTKESDSTA